MDEEGQKVRLEKVREVLGKWVTSGVVQLDETISQQQQQQDGSSTGLSSVSVKPVLQDASLDFIYLDDEHSYATVSKQLLTYWRKLAPGGIIAGHDFTRANSGVAEAVVHFAETMGRRLFLTGVQTARKDVMGNDIPPCCPSWYLVKEPSDEKTDSALEAAALRIAEEMNAETVVQGTVVTRPAE